MTYSVDLRKHLLSLKKDKHWTFAKAARELNVSRATLYRWHHKLEPQKNRNKKPIKIHDELMRDDVRKHPDSFLYELSERLKVSISGISDALKRLGLTRKKKH